MKHVLSTHHTCDKLEIVEIENHLHQEDNNRTEQAAALLHNCILYEDHLWRDSAQRRTAFSTDRPSWRIQLNCRTAELSFPRISIVRRVLQHTSTILKAVFSWWSRNQTGLREHPLLPRVNQKQHPWNRNYNIYGWDQQDTISLRTSLK